MFNTIYSTVMTCGTLIGIVGWGLMCFAAKLYYEAKEQITELRCACKFMQGKEAGKRENTETATDNE